MKSSNADGLARFFNDLNQIYGLVSERRKFFNESVRMNYFRLLDKTVKNKCINSGISPWFELYTDQEDSDYLKYKNDIGLDLVFISARFDIKANCFFIRTIIMLGADNIATEDYTIEELKEMFGISAGEGDGKMKRLS
jgi:hypothetical protein